MLRFVKLLLMQTRLYDLDHVLLISLKTFSFSSRFFPLRHVHLRELSLVNSAVFKV